VHALALPAQDRTAEAKQEADHGVRLARHSLNRSDRLRVEVAVARVRVASGRVAAAKKGLEAVMTEAAKYGFVGHQLEARLTLGEIELRNEKSSNGRAHLVALEMGAAAKGYTLIARRAAAARE
jgi:hypothetical protein